MLRVMEDSQIVDARLKENAELLRVLQEAQFAKLRRTSASNAERQLPSDTELIAVERLQESLTTLLNARPRSTHGPNILPAGKDAWRTIKQDLVQASTPIYQGTLDVHHSKSIRERFMGGRHPNGAPNMNIKPNISAGRKAASPKKDRKPSIAA